MTTLAAHQYAGGKSKLRVYAAGQRALDQAEQIARALACDTDKQAQELGEAGREWLALVRKHLSDNGAYGD